MTFQDIPGTTSPDQLELVSKLSYEVPKNGWIVEVGCYCGRQSIVLGRAKDDSVLLTCVDEFPEWNGDYGFSDWVETTAYLKNVEPLRAKSPILISNMVLSVSKQIDLLVIDFNDILPSLLFWGEFVGSGGKIVIHTYGDNELTDVVDQYLATRTEFKMHIGTENSMVLVRL